MKKIVSFLIVLCSVLAVCGQPGDILVDGRKWSVLSTLGDYKRTYIRLIKGDTLINGFTYKKIYSTRNEDLTELVYIGGMRKDGDKYYWRDHDSSRKEVLAMDFSLKVGDVHAWDWVDSHKYSRRWLVLESKDTLFAGENFKRKYIHLNRMYDSADILMPYHVDTWVEGIGSLTFGMGDPQSVWYDGRWPFLLCCTNASDSSPFYINQEYNSCYIDNVTSLHSPNAPSSVQIYSSGIGSVTFKWDVSLKYESLSIYFPDGILLRKMKIEPDQSQILVDKLPKGVYLYIIRASDNSQTSGKFSVD